MLQEMVKHVFVVTEKKILDHNFNFNIFDIGKNCNFNNIPLNS